MWKCRCKCGTEKAVRGCHLITGASTKCEKCRAKANIIDLTNQRFGKLIALEPTDQRSDSSVKWKCKCDCGNICYISSQSLIRGDTQSCGCLAQEKRIERHDDLTGQRFGRLVALEYVSSTQNKYPSWKCRCDCGNETIVLKQALVTGATTSCGCYARERSREAGMARAEDLTDQTFGKWHVLRRDTEHIGSGAYWICKCDCGTVRSVAGNSLKQGASFSCGCESRSKGERTIQELLDQNSISYEMQKTFDDCRYPDSKYLAKFDFFVNNKYIIEFDGKQHFIANGGWNTDDHFADTQLHDQYKNQWCKIKNIPLIRIPYTHLDILHIQDLLLETSNFIVI